MIAAIAVNCASRETHMTLTIKLVRHGESFANIGAVNPAEVGDHTIELTPQGTQQALHAGQLIGAGFLNGVLAYCSPFRRARQTLSGLINGANVKHECINIYEDPRLREVDHGYADVG